MTKQDAPKPVKPAEGSDTPTQATAEGMKRVKINAANPSVAEGAAYIHPYSNPRVVIHGDGTFTVPDDDWTDSHIRDKFLTEVR